METKILPPSNIDWNEKELQTAVLQILLDARVKKPKSGGASQQLMADILDIDGPPNLAPIINQMLADNLIEQGERLLLITPDGIDWIHNVLGTRMLLAPVFRRVIQTIADSDIGLSASEIVQAHQDMSLERIELALWYFVQSGRLAAGERVFTLTDAGRKYLSES